MKAKRTLRRATLTSILSLTAVSGVYFVDEIRADEVYKDVDVEVVEQGQSDDVVEVYEEVQPVEETIQEESYIEPVEQNENTYNSDDQNVDLPVIEVESAELDPVIKEEEILENTINTLSEDIGISSVDSTPPELLSVEINDKKEFYRPGDTVSMTVVVREESELDLVYATFSSNSPTSHGIGSHHRYTTIDNGDGTYTVDLTLQIPEQTSDRNYALSYISLGDNYTNSKTSWAYQTEMLQEISFDVVNEKEGVDSTPPELLSVVINDRKEFYRPGDTVSMTIKVREESELDLVYATFSSNSPTSHGIGSHHRYTTIDNGDGTYTVDLTLQIPEQTSDRNYALSYISLGDNYTNSKTSWAYQTEMLQEISFDVVNEKEGVDSTPPELLSVVINDKKEFYRPGDTVSMTIKVREESELDLVYATFSSNSPTSHGIGSHHRYTTIDNGDGTYTVDLTLQIPEQTSDRTYALSYISLNDNYENSETSWAYQTEMLQEISFDVKNYHSDQEEPENPVTPEEPEEPEEPVVSDDFSPDYTNVINILDANTNRVITRISYNGLRFENRLNDLILVLNSDYDTEFTLDEQELVSTRTSTTTVNNNRVTRTERTYNIYLSNISSDDVLLERPFIPSHELHDNSNRNSELKEITISYNGRALYRSRTLDNVTIDEFIRESMTAIDSALYYFDSVKVVRGITSLVSNGIVYRGPSHNIEVNVLQREVVEPPIEDPPVEDPPVEEPPVEEPPVEEPPVEEPPVEEPPVEEPPVEEPPVEEPPVEDPPVEEPPVEEPPVEEPPVEESPVEEPPLEEPPVEEPPGEEPPVEEPPVEEPPVEEPPVEEPPVEEDEEDERPTPPEDGGDLEPPADEEDEDVTPVEDEEELTPPGDEEADSDSEGIDGVDSVEDFQPTTPDDGESDTTSPSPGEKPSEKVRESVQPSGDALPKTGLANKTYTLFASILGALGLGALVFRRKN